MSTIQGPFDQPKFGAQMEAAAREAAKRAVESWLIQQADVQQIEAPPPTVYESEGVGRVIDAEYVILPSSDG